MEDLPEPKLEALHEHLRASKNLDLTLDDVGKLYKALMDCRNAWAHCMLDNKDTRETWEKRPRFEAMAKEVFPENEYVAKNAKRIEVHIVRWLLEQDDEKEELEAWKEGARNLPMV